MTESPPAAVPKIVRPSRFLRLARFIEHALAAAAVLAIIFVVTPLSQWLYERLDRPDPLVRSKYIVCLGGDPARVIEAARLLREGYGEKLVLSNFEDASRRMRDLALDWGAPADRIVLDESSRKTWQHPDGVRQAAGLDPAMDSCLIVTSFAHLARSKACFEKAGYRHIAMREPRWERAFRPPGGVTYRFRILPLVLYEYTALLEYRLRGFI